MSRRTQYYEQACADKDGIRSKQVPLLPIEPRARRDATISGWVVSPDQPRIIGLATDLST